MSNYKTTNPDALAEIFKALSNPNRLQIFQQLLNCCTPGTACSGEEATSCCVGDLGEDLSIAPSTLSHHVKELQRAGLIKTQRRGKNIDCFVDPEKISEIEKFFNRSKEELKTS